MIHGIPSGGEKRSKPTEVVVETEILLPTSSDDGIPGGNKGDKVWSGVLGGEWERERIYVMLRFMLMGFCPCSYFGLAWMDANVRERRWVM